MKKYGLVLALSLGMALSLSACGTKKDDVTTEVTSEVSTSEDTSSQTEASSTAIDAGVTDQTGLIDSDEKMEEAKKKATEDETEEDTTNLADETPVTTDNGELNVVPVTGDDTFGSIGGVGFNLKEAKALDFTETFGKAGFNFTADPDTYQTVLATAFDISNGNASVTATVQRLDADLKSTDNSINSIINEGFTSYFVSVKETVTSAKPYMTFKGCTWGSTVNDLIAAYGEPMASDKIESTAFTILTYRYEDYTIEFTVYNQSSGASGLQDVYVYPSMH